MIHLEEGTNGNICIFTLNENTTISAPIYYLFEFINNDSKVSKLFLPGSDTTTNRTRYNQFTITLVDAIDEDLLDGKINIKPGRYKYNIYQQNSPSNLISANAVSIVERGFVVYDKEITETTYSGNDTENIIYYNDEE